jgi:hypothetical protein
LISERKLTVKEVTSNARFVRSVLDEFWVSSS